MCRPRTPRTVTPEVGRILLPFGFVPSSRAALAPPSYLARPFALPRPDHLRTLSASPAVLAHNTLRMSVFRLESTWPYRGGVVQIFTPSLNFACTEFYEVRQEFIENSPQLVCMLEQRC
jgi:hypothetical protein